jgi:hypothetical protein
MPDRELLDRAAKLEHLTPDDWKQVLSALQTGGTGTREIRHMIYQIRSNYDLINAIHRLDQSSTRLSKRMVLLTWVIAILTTVLVIPLAVEFIRWLIGPR